jgi:hypothetical protein
MDASVSVKAAETAELDELRKPASHLARSFLSTKSRSGRRPRSNGIRPKWDLYRALSGVSEDESVAETSDAEAAPPVNTWFPRLFSMEPTGIEPVTSCLQSGLASPRDPRRHVKTAAIGP